MSRTTQVAAASSLAVLLAACGGGGGSGMETGGTAGASSGAGMTANTPPAASPAGNQAGGTATQPDTATTPPSSGAGNGTGTAPPAPEFTYDTTARFNAPDDLAFDRTGNFLVLDKGNRRIRSIAPTGSVSTLPGTYGALYDEFAADLAGNVFVLTDLDISRVASDGIRTPVASFPQSPGSYLPIAIAAGPQGSVHVLLRYRNSYRVNVIDASGAARTVYAFLTPGTATRIAVDAQGNLAIAASGPLDNTHYVRLVPRSVQPAEGNAAGVVDLSVPDGVNNLVYDATGNLHAVELRQQQTGTAESPAYTVSGMRVFRVAPDRTVTTLKEGFPGGSLSHSQTTPITVRVGLAPDAAGNVAISNPFTHAIYRLTPAGEYVLVAGKAGEAGSSD